ncbi:AraC family transcriptional regulator [Marinobacter sp. OP 3.4]|uniref:AraC family transcriptional regulator n=1 Tax=Marinobacter sp. OP 3.4 TaxID=3076501 RepID=UPI002E249973
MPQTNPVASMSTEHYLTTLKGLGRVVETPVLEQALARLPRLSGPSANTRIPLHHLLELHEGISDRCADPLLLVRAYQTLNYEPRFLARTFLAGAISPGDALSLVSRYAKVGSDLCSIELMAGQQTATLRVLPAPGFSGAREPLDAITYGFARILPSLGIPSMDVIRLDHVPSGPVQAHYRQLFPANLVFGCQERTIEFPAEYLSRPLDWHAIPAEKLARRERRLNQLQEQPQWRESVATLLPLLYRLGEANIDECARLLAVSRRSLQRRIRAEGYSFRELLDENRRKLAANYLLRGYSNDRTASLLGYRQPAQFYRSFREWYRCSPSEYRETIQTGLYQ